MGLLDFRDFWLGIWRVISKRPLLALLAGILIAWGVWKINYVQTAPVDGRFYKTVGYDEREVPTTREEWIDTKTKDTWFLVVIGLIVIGIYWRDAG